MTHEEYMREFEEACKQMVAMTRKKNRDYSGTRDAFGNFRNYEAFGIPAEKGILSRIVDKMSRISGLLERDAAVKDESIEDTLKDMAVYSIILLIYVRSKQK